MVMRFNFTYVNNKYDKCGTFGKMIQQVVGVFAMSVAICKFGQIFIINSTGEMAKLLFVKNANIITRIGVGATVGKIKCLMLVKDVGAKAP